MDLYFIDGRGTREHRSRYSTFLDCKCRLSFCLSDFMIFLTSQFAAAIEDDGIISDKLSCGLGKIDSTCSSILGSIFLKYFNNAISRNSELYFRNLTEISKFSKLNSAENYPLYGIYILYIYIYYIKLKSRLSVCLSV